MRVSAAPEISTFAACVFARRSASTCSRARIRITAGPSASARSAEPSPGRRSMSWMTCHPKGLATTGLVSRGFLSAKAAATNPASIEPPLASAPSAANGPTDWTITLGVRMGDRVGAGLEIVDAPGPGNGLVDCGSHGDRVFFPEVRRTQDHGVLHEHLRELVFARRTLRGGRVEELPGNEPRERRRALPGHRGIAIEPAGQRALRGQRVADEVLHGFASRRALRASDVGDERGRQGHAADARDGAVERRACLGGRGRMTTAPGGEDRGHGHRERARLRAHARAPGFAIWTDACSETTPTASQ